MGIDSGSLTTKAVILDGNDIVGYSMVSSADEVGASTGEAVKEALNNAGLPPESELYIVATGAGRKAVSLASRHKAVTTCLAKGIHHLLPSARTAIEIGAESTTVVTINERGRVSDWANPDKCAAGTGIFLHGMARILNISMEEMSELSMAAGSRADISSTCAVFAESEVISHVHRMPPTPREAIAAGIYYAVVSRVVSLCKRIGIKPDVALAGGVAQSAGLARMLGQELGNGVLVPEVPQIAAALGAAIIARENMPGEKP
jgi:predicted CoA-substrate-specific enzyme activase